MEENVKVLPSAHINSYEELALQAEALIHNQMVDILEAGLPLDWSVGILERIKTSLVYAYEYESEE